MSSPSISSAHAVAALLVRDVDGQYRPASSEEVLQQARRVLSHRVRRMTREQSAATLGAARQAGLTPGDYVADPVAGVPAVSGSNHRVEHIAMLIASCAELSTFSRNLNQLSSLLRQGAYRSAEEYRAMLKTLGADVRGLLDLVTRTLADLRPRKGAGLRGLEGGPASAGARP